jgi:predicted branched-subunit amino acid permease
MTGLREVTPALIATSIWAFVTGIAMVKAGMTEGMASLMTLLVYAGSAQLTALPLMVAGAPLWLIFAAGAVVNIRFVIFGAALQPYFRHYPWGKRLALGFWCSDISFVLFMTRYGDDTHKKGTSEQLWYYLGVIVPGWLSWQALSLLGIYVGGIVPDTWGLDFAATLALMIITLPLVTSRPMAVCVLVAGAVAWLGQPLPLRLGLAAAVVSGIVSGVAAEYFQSKKAAR